MDGFTVAASWRNDGTADLELACARCDWWHEWRGEKGPGYGSAPLAEVLAAAAEHDAAQHQS